MDGFVRVIRFSFPAEHQQVLWVSSLPGERAYHIVPLPWDLVSEVLNLYTSCGGGLLYSLHYVFVIYLVLVKHVLLHGVSYALFLAFLLLLLPVPPT